MPETLEEIKKLLASWEHQKNNKLTEARVCDAYIHAFNSVIELLEKNKPKKKESS